MDTEGDAHLTSQMRIASLRRVLVAPRINYQPGHVLHSHGLVRHFSQQHAEEDEDELDEDDLELRTLMALSKTRFPTADVEPELKERLDALVEGTACPRPTPSSARDFTPHGPAQVSGSVRCARTTTGSRSHYERM